MQQTYQNMNQVPLQNYTNFLGGSMNLGMQPYQSSGNIMPNNNIMDYMTDPEPTPDYIEEPDFGPGPAPVPGPILPNFTNPIFPDFSNVIPGQFDLGFLEVKPDVLPPDFDNDNTFPNPNPPAPAPSPPAPIFDALDFNQDGSVDVIDILAGFAQGADISGLGAAIGAGGFNTTPPLLPPYTGPPIFPDFTDVLPGGDLNLDTEVGTESYLPPYVGPPIFPDFSNIIPGQFDLGFETVPEIIPEPEPEIIPEPVLPDFSEPVFPDFSNVIPGQLNPDFSQPVFPDFSNVIPGQLDLGLIPYAPDEIDDFISDEQEEQMTENVENILATTQAPQFTGGGGQGGQAARRLYFPGTSGGFASVGTGIGGGGTTLDDLLRRMR